MDSDIRFDVRLIERNIAKGIITREEYEKFLKKLPDSAANAENVEQSLAERTYKQVPYLSKKG